MKHVALILYVSHLIGYIAEDTRSFVSHSSVFVSWDKKCVYFHER